jgi:hypothetical protein
MDLVVAKRFDEMLKRFEDFNAHSAERWGWLEKRIEDATAAFQECEGVVDERLASLENFASA